MSNFRIFDAEFDRSALREVLIFVYFSCKVNVNYGESRIVDSEPEKEPISVDCQKQAIMSHRDTILIVRFLCTSGEINLRSWLNLPRPKIGPKRS